MVIRQDLHLSVEFAEFNIHNLQYDMIASLNIN